MLTRSRSTDHLRRLALQIAGQLPDSVEDARNVLDYLHDLLDGFLIVGPRAIAMRPEPPPPPLSWSRRVALALAAFGLIAPPAVLVAHVLMLPEVSSAFLMLGTAMVALVLGSAAAVMFAAAGFGLNNLVVMLPYYTFSWPSGRELALAAGMLAIAVLLPWVEARAARLRERWLNLISA